MWAIRGKNARNSIKAICKSPLQRAQTYSHHAHDVFLCIYMYIYIYICERPDNTRVGANCNSPFHMGGAIENMGEFAMRANLRKKRTQQHRAICKSPLQHTQKTSCQYQCSMINVQWLMFTDPCSLTSAHFSLFTLHFSLPSPLLLLFSFLTTILLDLYIKNVVLLHRI